MISVFDDNAALYHALKQGLPVVPLFIFDTNILDKLDEKADRRVTFIHAALEHMQEGLLKLGSSLEVYHGTPEEVFGKLLDKYTIQKLFTNHDYEPYAQERDERVRLLLNERGVSFHTYKDQVIFEKAEVVKEDGKPYTVFTPYSRRWKATLTDFHLKSYPVKKYHQQFYKQAPQKIPFLQSIGFRETETLFPARMMREELIRKYKEQRDYPAIQGTSRLGCTCALEH